MDKNANEFIQLKGVKHNLWWLQNFGCERVVAHDVTLDAYNTNKFLGFL